MHATRAPLTLSSLAEELRGRRGEGGKRLLDHAEPREQEARREHKRRARHLEGLQLRLRRPDRLNMRLNLSPLE